MELRILCVHGVGLHPPGGPWEADWRRSIEEPLAKLDAQVKPVIEFAYLDDIFDDYEISPLDVLEALAKLSGSAIGSLFRQPKGLGDSIRWTAGMVVQWVENDTLRKRTRARLKQRIEEFRPQIIVAHSLGSLVSYDTFTAPGGAELIATRRFVSAGSQIGNPFVVGNFAAGRLDALSTADFWYHLYNPEDDVFTAPVKLTAANFVQIDTLFDIPGIADHEVTEYMRHERAVNTVWADAVMGLRGHAVSRGTVPTQQQFAKLARQAKLAHMPAKLKAKPSRRALLVGVNEYPDPSQNLQGCVNDVFLVSSLLQESGFDASEIRVVLNDRATCKGVNERLEWLLEDAGPDATRFFYYSGHGAQVPSYGPNGEVDRVQETLALHDFDWSAGRTFTDEQFYALYSQLPYESQFIAMFDCCHSGGMTRAGARRVRGIDPPDDIRHRMLRWDAKREMWVPRDFASPAPGFDKKFNHSAKDGSISSTHRLGQAMSLRALDSGKLKAAAKARGHLGPYLPTLVYASREDQYSYEYQHGSVAHGAFTYSLVKTLRNDRRRKKQALSFEALVALVRDELAALGYEQEPLLVAPSKVKTSLVPLRT